MRTSSICDESIHLSLGFQIYDNNIFCKKMCVIRYVNSRSIRSRALFYLLRIYQFYLPGLVHVITDQRSWLIRDIFEFSVIRMWSLSFSTRKYFSLFFLLLIRCVRSESRHIFKTYIWMQIRHYNTWRERAS